jgi:hypothetical protein
MAPEKRNLASMSARSDPQAPRRDQSAMRQPASVRLAQEAVRGVQD